MLTDETLETLAGATDPVQVALVKALGAAVEQMGVMGARLEELAKARPEPRRKSRKDEDEEDDDDEDRDEDRDEDEDYEPDPKDDLDDEEEGSLPDPAARDDGRRGKKMGKGYGDELDLDLDGAEDSADVTFLNPESIYSAAAEMLKSILQGSGFEPMSKSFDSESLGDPADEQAFLDGLGYTLAGVVTDHRDAVRAARQEKASSQAAPAQAAGESEIMKSLQALNKRLDGLSEDLDDMGKSPAGGKRRPGRGIAVLNKSTDGPTKAQVETALYKGMEAGVYESEHMAAFTLYGRTPPGIERFL